MAATPLNSVPLATPTGPPVGRPETLIEDEFRRLVEEWKRTRKTTSTAKRMAENRAYQKIIAMGKDAVPLIISEMEREPDHWFIALHAITGASPVPENSRGKFDEMTKAWIDWWRRQSASQ